MMHGESCVKRWVDERQTPPDVSPDVRSAVRLICHIQALCFIIIYVAFDEPK